MCCDHDSHYIDPILLLIRTHTGTCLQSTIAEITHNCVKSSQMCGSARRKRKGGMLSPLFPYVPWLLLLCTGIQMTGRRCKAKEKGDVNVNIKTRRTFNRCIHIISYWPYSFNLTNFRMKSLDTRALHFNASGHFFNCMMQLEFDHIQYNTINTRTLLYLKLKAIKIDTIPFVLISTALHFTSLTSPPIFLLGFNTLSTL